MKKFLVLAALTVAAAPAMASKARLTALGSNNASTQLVDTQTVFFNAADIHLLGDYATLEFGSATVGSTPRSEGGFLRTMSFGKLGAYLGHRDASFANFLGTGMTATMATEQNPIDLFYGSDLGGLKWAIDLHYSSTKNEQLTPNEKIGATALSFGIKADAWKAYVTAGLGAKGEKTDNSVINKSDSMFRVGGQYNMGAWTYALNVEANNSKDAADAKTERMNWDLSAINSMAIDGGSVFYGVKYASTESKVTAGKDTSSKLPIVVGVEGEAASWMTLRASITQSVLISETKNAAGNKTSNLNDTAIGAGVGLKFNKLVLDATLAGNANGNINGTDLLANAAVTYLF